MAKNVIVVDELGNEYAPTYAKRARGLVKQGRARWLDENTICLACPPNDIDLEDNVMNNTDKIADVMENIEVVSTEVQPESRNEAKITAAEILARIDKIIAQGEELAAAVQTIKDLPVNDSPYGGEDGKARAEAIRDICIRRENTNQKMLDMLEELLHPEKSNSSMIDRVMNLNFTGVGPDTAKIMLDFIERNS